MKGFVVAAPASGSGKTTVTLGLMEALKRRGLVVAPFKVGPDFIDPGYHRLVTGRASINLDPWMCGEEFVAETFARHTRFADAAVVEGVMGLFDGIGETGEGSTAHVAALLDLPVLLVVDVKGQAGSVAPLVSGFARFDPRVRIAGVIFNNAGSDGHIRILTDALNRSLPEVPVLGGLLRDDNLLIPSRHLGLVTAEENPLSPYYLHALARMVTKGIDVDRLLALLEEREPRHFPAPVRGEVHIAVARDSAFCFIYEDNLRLLREAGAELEFFSPLNDEALPEGVAGLYLPGGYPEIFAERLAANFAMKNAVRRAVEGGMPVLAECGGFLYLTRGMVEADAGGGERVRHFVGIFPVTARLLPRRKALGYREVETLVPTLLGGADTRARGHEFHYSEIAEMPEQVARSYRLRRQGRELGLEGYLHRSCLASYIHLHFGSNPDIPAAFVGQCRAFAEGQKETS